MKKLFYFSVALALLLSAGCQKNDMQSDGTDAIQSVTFNASLSNDAMTKAADDNDGHAEFVNRCIMEIYFDGELFERQYAKVVDKKCSFVAKLVSSRTYTVAFWADHVDHPDTQDGLKTDKYYTTKAAGGLHNVSLNTSIAYKGNDDARDAFFNCDEYLIAQDGTTSPVTLKRPFAQINVITTDVATIAKVESLKPDQVEVEIKNACTSFDVLQKKAGTPADLTYTAPVYNWDATKHNATLSMDYIFASTEKELIDIEWDASKANVAESYVNYYFNDIPYQRNYRTNIKGELLTTQGKWNVTIDPEWYQPDVDQDVFIATELESAQDAVKNGTASTVIVKQEAVDNRDQSTDLDKDEIAAKTGVTVADGAKGIEFDLTSSTKDNTVFDLPKLPDGDFYWVFKADGYSGGAMNINMTTDDASKLIIDAADGTHVTVNGVNLTEMFVSSGDNSLIIPVGTNVDKLTIRKGGVEIHGTVGTIAIDPIEIQPGVPATIKFRACEGLSNANYQVIKDYIDRPTYAEKQNGEKWDIVKSGFVNETKNTGHSSIGDAIAAAEDGDVINVLAEEVAFPAISKAGLTFKGNGETKITSFAGAAANTTIDGFNFTVATGYQCGYEDFTVKNSKFTGDGHAIRAAYNKGTFTIDNCEFLQKGQYGIHFDGNSGTVNVKDSKITGSVALAGTIESIDFTDCYFAGKGNCGKCNINIYNKATFTGCTFSQDYTTGASRGILMLGKNNSTKITVDNCRLTVEGTFTDIFRKDYVQGIASIDAEVDSDSKYTAGTFVAADIAPIKGNMADICKLSKLETSVYTVSVIEPVGNVFTAEDDDVLAAVLKVIEKTPAYWGKAYTIQLGAGTFTKAITIKQYPEWNGKEGTTESGNNMDYNNPDNEKKTILTLKGADNLATKWESTITVVGFGYSRGNDPKYATDVLSTTIDGVAFDYSSLATKPTYTVTGKSASSNVIVRNCSFKNCAYCNLMGENNSYTYNCRLENSTFESCEVICQGRLKGDLGSVLTGLSAKGTSKGFLNAQAGSTISVDNCDITFTESGSYGIRTPEDSGLDINVVNSRFYSLPSDKPFTFIRYNDTTITLEDVNCSSSSKVLKFMSAYDNSKVILKGVTMPADFTNEGGSDDNIVDLR